MSGTTDRLVGRLSVVGAGGPREGFPLAAVLRRSAAERTLPIVCRNLGIPCGMEASILARQLAALDQAREIARFVEVMPLKGLHLAHRVYPSPGLRDMGDIDLLVRRAERPAADGRLRALGYEPQEDTDRLSRAGGGFLNAVLYARDGDMPVHLHWHVSNATLPYFMYRIDVDEIWKEARVAEMAPHHLVVTLCEHALKHSYRFLIHLSDIEIASRRADWARVAEAAGRWGLGGAVFYALVLIRDLLGVESEGLRWIRRRSLGVSGRAFLELARRRRWEGLSSLGLFSLVRGWPGRWRFLREALAPARRESAGFSSRTPWKRLGRAVRMVGQGLAGRSY